MSGITPQPNPISPEVTQLLLTVGSGLALGFLAFGKKIVQWLQSWLFAGGKRKGRQSQSQLLMAITTIMELKEERRGALAAYKDEGRKIVRRWAAMLVHVMQGEASATIRSTLSGKGIVDHDPIEVLTWKSAGLSGRYIVIEEAMISVESNHYNLKNDREWEYLQDEVFTAIWSRLIAYYSDLYRSARVSIDTIIGAMEADRESHFRTFCTTFDRIRVLSVEVAEKVDCVDKQIDTILAEYRLKEIGK